MAQNLYTFEATGGSANLLQCPHCRREMYYVLKPDEVAKWTCDECFNPFTITASVETRKVVKVDFTPLVRNKSERVPQPSRRGN